MSAPSRATRQRNETRLPAEEDPEFQIAPMIDILLVLLVFFMSISSTEVLQKTEDVTLPIAKNAKGATKNPNQVIVNVVWVPMNNSGSLSVDQRRFSEPAELVPMLQRQLTANPDTRVLIRADRQVRYEYLRSILEVVGRAGVANVTFSVVDKEEA